MLQKIVRIFGGDPNKRQIEKYSGTVTRINGLEGQFEAYSDEALRLATDEFRRRLAVGETLDDLLPEAYAVVREAAKRTLGQRHYDVQLIGGIVLHEGKIAEMRTGEGKTLVATLPLYLNALTLNPAWVELARQRWGEDPSGWDFVPMKREAVGRGVHLITVNDYLARRDARWMGVVYDALGLSVGVLQMATRAEEGRRAFLVDLERASPHEDQNQLRMVSRLEAYLADITYGTNSEFGFDYLRDNMTMKLEDRVQQGHHYAIIDEVDNVLIDEARTPLIISGPAQDDTEWYVRMAQVVKSLAPEDYEISERDRSVTLSEMGETHVEELLGIPLRDPERPEDVTPEQARLMGYLEQALRAQFLFKRNKEYLVQSGKVIIVDEFTGRVMPGRRWSDGLHQAVEAKEGVRVQRENVTYATITIQNYFRMYEKLAGMSGTAVTEAEEFDKIYNLDVLAIPTNLEYIASRPETDLVVAESRDEQGYKFEYYTDRTDPQRTPVFWKRKDYPDVVYRTEEVKLRAIAREIMRCHILGQPVLVGTTSVELSERVSGRLRAEPIRRLAQILLLRDAWMEANDREEDGRLVPELAYLNQTLDQLPIAEMRKMARDLGISFNPDSPENLSRLAAILELTAADEQRLSSVLQAGVSHQVLNARKHAEEGQIITGAGAFGAVTIATNMAGRGVDIKLGGELPEDILTVVNRVLRRAGHKDPYDMKMEQRHEALLALDPKEYGIYEQQIERFFEYMRDMARVKSLGGLHVIGSERHEARRIDNQLRGRAARQGDPGSSRFYLSMQDDLMRLFGGEQAEAMMERLKIDDALPLEVALVGRIIEQAQTRVEGQNFDTRKHLLEYDDVLNAQRSAIYTQRDRIFFKDDLSEDVTEMLQTEVLQRVPRSLEGEEGPWKLLAWLEQVQPSFKFDSTIYPSYTLRLIRDHTLSGDGQYTGRSLLSDLLAIARQSIDAEEEHVRNSVENLLEQIRTQLESQIAERREIVDIFLEGLEDEDEEAQRRNPRQLAEELSDLLHLSLKLSSKEQQMLRDDPEQAAEIVTDQVESALVDRAAKRLIGAVERRLEDGLDMDRLELMGSDWDMLLDLVLDDIHSGFDKRRERLIGEDGAGLIARDLENYLNKVDGPLDEHHQFTLLSQMPQGERLAFDRRTHRRVKERTTRLNYVFYAASFLGKQDPDEIAEDVLEHLEEAQSAMRRAWGRNEWNRLKNARPMDLDETTRRGLRNSMGSDRYTEIEARPLRTLPEEEQTEIMDELGRQSLTEVYRQLLLRVISEVWVEYLTSMEALRISIGLEAYGQRDPLIQYKNRAFEMFQELLSNTRLGVISRMFTFRPHDLSSVQTTVTVSQPEVPALTEDRTEATAKKTRRRRRRR